jgi:arylesterase / paraoxonase
MENFNDRRGLSLHGMDVVTSESDPSALYVYLVNHRPPNNQDAQQVGADSSIEILKTSVGSDVLTHVKTVESPVIVTPNDIAGYPDGKQFYFTNDNVAKVGSMVRDFLSSSGVNFQHAMQNRYLSRFVRADTSVGYCHAEDGCKFAITGLQSVNGVARAQNDTIYVANSMSSSISMLERQADNRLAITDVVKTGWSLSNMSRHSLILSLFVCQKEFLAT